MKVIKKILIAISGFLLIVLVLFYFDVIWKSPPFYKVKQVSPLETPIMDMKEYENIISTHRRPYIYSITSKNGAIVSIVGVNHKSNPTLPQFDSIRAQWKKLNPDIALVEGRVGFFFSWFQDPIEEYGESGLTSYLAKKEKKELYTWEPSRQDEINLLVQKYTPEQLIMLYCLRPYFSMLRGGKISNPEEKMNEFIKERTDYEHLKNVFSSYEDLDREWKKYYPTMDWRNYKNKSGYMPEGIMYELWNSSNMARDEHLVQIILESIQNNKNVFATVGVSHAPRIEKTLRTALQ